MSYDLSVTGTTAIGADTAATGTGTIALAADTAATGTGSVAIAADDAAVGSGTVAILDDVGAIKNGGVQDVTTSADLETDFSAGTLTVSVNGVDTDIEIGSGEVNTGADLLNALNAIDGVTADGRPRRRVEHRHRRRRDAGDQQHRHAGCRSRHRRRERPGGVNLLTQFGSIDGQDMTVSVGGTDHTVTFGYGAGEVSTKEDLLDSLNTAFAGQATFAFNGDNELTVTATDAADTVEFGGDAAATLGFGAGNTEFAATNTTLAGITGTMTVTDGSDTYNVDFSTIQNTSQLLDALGGIGSLSGDNELVLTSSDPANTLSISASDDAMDVLGLDAEYEATNTTLAGITGTMSVTVGEDTYEVDFSQVQNSSQLLDALGGAGTLNADNELVITAGNATDSISVTASDNAMTALGLSAGYGPTNADLGAMAGQTLTVQVGTHSAQSFSFAADTTRADLETWMSGLDLGDDVSIGLNADNEIELTSTSSDAITFGGTAAATLGLEGDDEACVHAGGHHLRRERHPHEPSGPVQRTALADRHAGQRRLLQRHQPAERRQSEGGVQRGQLQLP